MIDLSSAGLRQSSQTPQPSQAAMSSSNKTIQNIFGLFTMLLCASDILYKSCTQAPTQLYHKAIYKAEVASSFYDETVNTFRPMVFAANQQQNEMYTYKDMLQQPDAKDFVLAMLKEITVHEDRNLWTLMKCTEVPPDKLVNGKVKTIMSIWSFKRKRFPSGELNNHKAWLCAHGSMQQWGVDFWEMYSPFVNWITVRTLLAVASIHKLPTQCIDFVLAFPQAEPDINVFMALLIGMAVDEGNSRDYVLKLNKSIIFIAS
eukprot:10482008-Ditylum_brightwellii.AAC.1